MAQYIPYALEAVKALISSAEGAGQVRSLSRFYFVFYWTVGASLKCSVFWKEWIVGIMALYPADAKEGDLILVYLFRGAKIPFVVREESGHYGLAGACYGDDLRDL